MLFIYIQLYIHIWTRHSQCQPGALRPAHMEIFHLAGANLDRSSSRGWFLQGAAARTAADPVWCSSWSSWASWWMFFWGSSWAEMISSWVMRTADWWWYVFIYIHVSSVYTCKDNLDEGFVRMGLLWNWITLISEAPFLTSTAGFLVYSKRLEDILV